MWSSALIKLSLCVCYREGPQDISVPHKKSLWNTDVLFWPIMRGVKTVNTFPVVTMKQHNKCWLPPPRIHIPSRTQYPHQLPQSASHYHITIPALTPHQYTPTLQQTTNNRLGICCLSKKSNKHTYAGYAAYYCTWSSNFISDHFRVCDRPWCLY